MKHLAIVATGLAVLGALYAAPAEYPRSLDEFAAYVESEAAGDRFSGAVIIAKDGVPLFAAAFGKADRARGIAMTLDTPINLGSMNKMFTGVAIAKLVEQGKLSYHDPVGRHLPDHPNETVRDRVTIHQLLTHTSGLGSYWNEA